MLTSAFAVRVSDAADVTLWSVQVLKRRSQRLVSQRKRVVSKSSVSEVNDLSSQTASYNHSPQQERLVNDRPIIKAFKLRVLPVRTEARVHISYHERRIPVFRLLVLEYETIWYFLELAPQPEVM